MKFVILHGTDASHESNWFPWLKNELERQGHEVWVPDLPDSQRPNIHKYNELLLNNGYDFNNSVVIGHSSGSVAILGLLETLPHDMRLHTAILVGAFTKRLSESPSWEMLQELFHEPFNFESINQKANQFIFIHSNDDPYCPIDDARELCEDLSGKFIEFEGMGHFSKKLDPRFEAFPELLNIINEKVIS